jgi:hypothetical protein
MIVEGFGGKMTVSSAIGEGTTMTLLLPTVENEAVMAGDGDFSDRSLPDEANGFEKTLVK